METIKLEVNSASDPFGHTPSTFMAELDNPESFRDRLRKLNALCKEHQLAEVRDFRSGDWLDSSNELCATEYETLVVSMTYFWFEALLKFSDARVETQAIEIGQYL